MAMNKGEEAEFHTLRNDNERLRKENTRLSDDNQDMSYELTHYRAAVAAVKWLWDQASAGRPFQM